MKGQSWSRLELLYGWRLVWGRCCVMLLGELHDGAYAELLCTVFGLWVRCQLPKKSWR